MKNLFENLSHSKGVRSCNTCVWKKRGLLDKLLVYIGLSRFLETSADAKCLHVTVETHGDQPDMCYLQTLWKPMSVYPKRCSSELLNWEPVNAKERFIFKMKHKNND